MLPDEAAQFGGPSWSCADSPSLHLLRAHQPGVPGSSVTHQHFALNDGLELLWFFAVASNRDRDARPLPTGVGFRYLESA